MVKLNLGSGPDGVKGWTNFDWGVLPLVNRLGLIKLLVNLKVISSNYLREWPEFSLVDIRKGLPVESKSVDWIYCSHVLEHFERYETGNLLKEIKRVLRKGGRVRIVLPDLKKVIKKYGEDADEFCRKFWGYEKDKTAGWQSSFIRPHHWMYNEKSFEKILRESGFKKIELKGYQESLMPDVEKLDLKLHEDISMYIEAVVD